MTYSKLLLTDRRRKSTVGDRNILTESESDRGRILFCPPFRRLQQKAQVFSMEPNAAVRSRLTHSLEVAQIGRYIADLIGVQLIEKELATEEQCRSLVIFVETACLMHDIGNPPFGHFGEAAIQKWFKNYGEIILKKAITSKEINTNEINKDWAEKTLADFYEFDGNPQGLRIVSKLQWNTDSFGLNLTKTTLASYLKYLRAPCRNIKENSARFQKKAGFFSTEKSIVHDVWESFGYDPMKPQRFPLAYIMEAADDIAYCISDLEDSIEKGLLDEKSAFIGISGQWQSESKSSENIIFKEITEILRQAAIGQSSSGNEFTFTDFRTSLNRVLVKFAAEQYIANHSQILSGNFDTLISIESPAGKILSILKNYCKERVYCHESVQRTELAGYTAISGLLDHFREILECSSERFTSALNAKDKDAKEEKIITEKKLLSLFPKRYKKVYEDHVNEIGQINSLEKAALEWNARAHFIVDFVSGMTDDFAMTTYRTLSGMRL